ncbi:hypothetical protein C8J57DRAFT_1496891 [Mycena rebaudengoi]|nr:hypothetical protein C8J57DRAFT_1496891 [Mycena rebaudengoi]
MNARSAHRIERYPTPTDMCVSQLTTSIARRIPAYLRLYRGVFYGCACVQPHIVGVPVDHTASLPKNSHTVDDLDIDDWMDETLGGVVDMEPYFHHVQDASGRRAFMVVKMPPDEFASIPQNSLLESMGMSIFGNVLVMALDAQDNLKNARVSDIPVTTTILKHAVRDGLFV